MSNENLRGVTYMKEYKRLPESELILMRIIWDAKEPVSSLYIMDKLKDEKTWTITTVLNLLARLVNKGFLTSERHGKANTYAAVVEEEPYLEIESRSFLSRVHGNSLTSLMASLINGKSITQKDIEELKKFIDKNSSDEGSFDETSNKE